MKKMISSITLAAALLSMNALADKLPSPTIIPRPLELTINDGQFSIESGTQIFGTKAFKSEAKFLAKAIRKSTGKKLKLNKGKGHGISFVKKAEYAKEGYGLKVSKAGIVIEASHKAGAFYAVQTLLQSLPNELVVGKKYQGQLIVPSMNIKDEPRFAWRAFMLDEARHFKGMKEVKKILDQMAQHKMNVFHWHLTDDQGWRIEIKKYPKLTTIGSKRTDTQTGTWGSPTRTGEPHSGFYTQEQIKEIVKYAADRHITIVPEIGMPGHAVAAIAAYPYLGCSGEEIEVMTIFGKAHDVYNPARETTYTFISEVIDEVIELFPSQVIHVGGDEVRFGHWKKSADVQKMMKEKGLKTMADVQIYFTNRVAKIVESKGRNIMGWNEIMGDDLHGFLKDGQTASAAKLDPKTVVHFWKGNSALAKRAIEKGHDVVNSTHNFTYLDYGYGSISLGRAYGFDPIIAGLDKKYHHKIKGFGCQMWSEWIPTVKRMENQIYPRFSAYAETGWTAKSRKDFGNFKKRMKVQTERWDLLGIQYATNQVSVVSASDFFNHVKIGSWNPQTVGNSYKTLDFDATAQIQDSGTYEAVLLYQKGGHAIDIQSVALYEDGKKISEDKHIGFSGGRLTKITYKLNVKNFKKGAKYTLKASVKGSGGHDTHGVVKIIAK